MMFLSLISKVLEEEIINPVNEENNVYAKNVQGVVLHILEAPSGQKGYYCLGCDKEMQAVRQSISYRMSYYRHVHNAEQHERKCTYSDETYRHKLAKRILLQNLYIKVPPVYKYAPKGVNGLANQLKESEIISAHKAIPEITIYEDENGNIKWGSNIEVDEKYLLVKPDITFFDEIGQPMLLVELVATHKVDNEKKIKLRRLGINSVQVKIPKDSPESIENAFNVTHLTKWIYNYEESSTEYVPIPESNTEGILPIDEHQRSLFEETFSCRMSQTGNLIRTINKFVESQYYRAAEEGFRLEIRRVEKNTDTNKSRLEDLRTECKERVFIDFESQVKELEQEEDAIQFAEGDLRRHHSEVETRYYSKDAKLGSEEIAIDREVYGEVEIEGGNGETVEDRRREILITSNEIRRSIEEEERIIKSIDEEERIEINRIEEEEGGLSEYFRREAESLTEKFNRNTTKENRDYEGALRELEEIQGKFQSLEDELRNSIKLQEDDLPREFGEKDERIEKDAEGLREQADGIIKYRHSFGDTELHNRVRKLVESKGLYEDFCSARSICLRIRKAHEACKTDAYENWVE